MSLLQRIALSSLSILLLVPSLHAADTAIVYERDIAPIFRSYCAGCHNDKDREGELTVERYSTLRKGGAEEGDPIKPGHADQSFLIRSLERVASPKMPPKGEPPVSEADLALLKKWIAAGAHGPARDESILQTLVVPQIKSAAGKPPLTALAISPDGKQMAVGTHGRIEIRDANGKRVQREINGLPGKVNTLNFSPDGSRIVAATGVTGLRGVAQIWDVAKGTLLREFGGHGDTLYDAEFSPDGKTLATAGYDRLIKLWRVADGGLLHTIEVHNGAVFDLVFNPEGTVLASASADNTVKLWRVSDGERLDTLNQPQGEQHRVNFTPDGNYIISAGNDKRIYLWKFVSREKPKLNPLIHARFAHESPITAITLSADGRHLITSAADRSLKVWSVPDLTERHAYDLQSDIAATLVSVPKTARFFAARLDGSLGRYVLKTDAEKPESRPLVERTDTLATSSREAAILEETEPNDDPKRAMAVSSPVEIKGNISHPGDTDLFRFRARASEEIMLAINAARSKSQLDSRIEVLTAKGEPIEQVVLQAVRESWFTFRGKDSDTSDDFRLHNWAQMELDEYFYANGEVVKLWLYPRGPDSGFKVYPGAGKRTTAFSTTALTHALNEPGYTVVPHPPGSTPAPNGLPVFRLNYENDDDPGRDWGTDSLLLFTAPKAGEYLARVTDVRGFGGETNFHYALTIRDRRPDFSVKIGGMKPKISPGSGRELTFTARRIEGFDGPIRIDITNLPAGFTASTPVEIEAGQETAMAVLHAAPDAVAPDEAADKAVSVTAAATIRGQEISHDLGTLGDIQLGAQPKLTVEILPSADRSVVKQTPGGPLEFFIRPGQSITALARTTRHDFKGRIELGKEDAGRNLPHGLYVDNIGLNGLLVVEGETEREFFITAAPIAKPGKRLFHLVASADDGQASLPVVIHVLPPAPKGKSMADRTSIGE